MSAVERIIPLELAPNSPLLKEHLYRYLFALREIFPGETVLDAACGCGYGSAMLATKADDVIAIDKSKEAIQYAESHYAHDNITYLIEDLESNSILWSFLEVDVTVCLETLEHLVKPSEFLEKIKRITKRAIVLSTPIVPTRHINPYHLHDWTKEDIERMMQPWAVKTFEQQDIYGLWVFTRPGETGLRSRMKNIVLGVEAEVIRGNQQQT